MHLYHVIGRFPLLITIATIFIGSYFTGITSSVISTLCVLLVVLIGIVLTLLTSKLLSKTILKGIPSSFTSLSKASDWQYNC